VDADRLPTIDELAALVEARAEEQLPATRLRVAIDLSRELTDLSGRLARLESLPGSGVD